jgi:hypothetical protein
LSIDIAERNGLDLRRLLASDDFFSDCAMARALFSLNTPARRSIALLSFVTFADHRLRDVDLARACRFDLFVRAALLRPAFVPD